MIERGKHIIKHEGRDKHIVELEVRDPTGIYSNW